MANGASGETTTYGGFSGPSLRSSIWLFAGGLAGLLVWEIWAKYATPPVAGFPLEPPELVRTLVERWTGVTLSFAGATFLHWLTGVVFYPLAYWYISRCLPRWGLILELLVWLSLSIALAVLTMRGAATSFHLFFWICVTALSASRLVNPHPVIADALTWGSFTWLNALGIMAPLAGQPFLLLSDYAPLSFMSWAGHVIYGAVAVIVFETATRKRS